MRHHFLSVREVALRLGVHRATVYRLIASGQFPRPVRLAGVHGQAGGRIAWPEDEVALYAQRLIADRDAHFGKGRTNTSTTQGK